jgi:hypothetical protein
LARFACWAAGPARSMHILPAFRCELGSTTLGDHIVTREEVEACCTRRPMAVRLTDIHAHLRTRMLAGIDWGGGAVSRTVAVIGCITDEGQLDVRTMIAMPVQEDPECVVQAVADLCQRFRVCAVAADGAGNGTVYNTLLLGRLPQLPRLFGMQYAATDHGPKAYRSRYLSWIIARSPSIGAIFHRIKMRRIAFPQLTQSAPLLREIYCETAEYDPHNRSVLSPSRDSIGRHASRNQLFECSGELLVSECRRARGPGPPIIDHHSRGHFGPGGKAW